MTLGKINFMDFMVHSSSGKKITFLIFIPRSAAQTKSKQFHHWNSASLILTAQQNASYPGKGGQKGTIQCSHHFSMAASTPSQKPHTTARPGVQSFAPTKKISTDLQDRKTHKGNSKVKLHLKISKFLCYLIPRVEQKSKEIKAAIGCNPDTIITWSATIPAGFLTLLSWKLRAQSRPCDFFNRRAYSTSPILFFLIAINYSDL